VENRYKLTYDLKKKNITSIIYKQGSIGSAVLEVTLTDDGKIVVLTGETLVFNFKRTDGSLVTQDITKGVTILDAANGVVECVLASLGIPGVVVCEIYSTKNGSTLPLSSFNFMVEESIGVLSIKYIAAINDNILNWQSDIDSIKAEYDTYKNVMIDASPVANLQSQLNAHTSELAHMTKLLDSYVSDYLIDSTTEIQNFFNNLDSDKLNIVKINKIFKIKNLVVTNKPLILIGTGGFLGQDDISPYFVTFDSCSQLQIKGITIDGNSKYQRGLCIINCPNCEIAYNKIKNVGSGLIDNIHGLNIGLGSDGANIHDNTINNIVSIAIARGIIVSNFLNTTLPINNLLIEHNKIKDIKPITDSDGICFDLGLPTYSWVKNNQFYNCYKRAIKIIASNVWIEDNEIYRDIVTNAYSCISIYGYDCIINNNHGKCINALFGMCIDTKGSRHKITNNTFENDPSIAYPVSDGIDLQLFNSETLDDFLIQNNRINRVRYGIRIANTSNRIKILNNTFNDINSNNIYIITGTHDKLLIEGNVCNDTPSAKVFCNLASSIMTKLTIKNNIYQGQWGVSGGGSRGISNLIQNNLTESSRDFQYIYGKKIEYKSAQPSSGNYFSQDEVINTVKTELGTTPNKYIIEKWVCTVGDGTTLGTWIQQRMLTGN